MTGRITRQLIVLPVALVVAAAVGSHVLGYSNSGKKWGATRISYFVNPKSVWVSQSAATTAVQQAAAAWNQQSRANIELVYAGQTTGTSLSLNYKNEVFFRNGSNGGYVAETYYWWDGSGRLVDADIVFWEGAYRYYTGSGCQNGIYIESAGTHEFGHFLGLGHSSIKSATMTPTMPTYCDRTWMTLDADDIAGIETLYPPTTSAMPPAPSSLSVAQNSASPTSSLVISWSDNAGNELGFRIERSRDGSTWAQLAQLGVNVKAFTDTGLSAGTTYYYRVYAFNGSGSSSYSNVASGRTASAGNTAPTVTLASPGNNATFAVSALITFSGSASDAEDGSLSSRLVWRSNLAGTIGSGASFSRSLTVGTHTITATVTDSYGASASKQVAVVVISTSTTSATLSAHGYKVKGFQKADLTWKGLSSSSVTVFRNGGVLRTLSNSGSWTDAINRKGGGSYRYKVCESGTSVCSNEVTVTF